MTILKKVKKTISLYNVEKKGLVFINATFILMKKQVRINDRIDGKNTSCYSMVVDFVGSRFVSNLRKNSTSTTTVFSCYFLDRKKDEAYNILLEKKIEYFFDRMLDLSINTQCFISYTVNTRDFINIVHSIKDNKLTLDTIVYDYNTKKPLKTMSSIYTKHALNHIKLLENDKELDKKKEVVYGV